MTPETLLSTFCSIVWEWNQGSSSHAGLCSLQAAPALCFRVLCAYLSVSGFDEIFHLQSLVGLSFKPARVNVHTCFSFLLSSPRHISWSRDQISSPCKNTKYSNLIEMEFHKNNCSPGQKC